MSTALRLAAVAMCLVSVSAGCGLFEADGGSHMLLSDGGGSPANEDTGGSSHPDARVREAGVDARKPDATHHDDAGTDGKVMDSGGNDGPIVDALKTDAPALGFCASFVTPPGTTSLCEDFDENPDANAAGYTVIDPGGLLSVQQAVAKSSPNALSATATPSTTDGGSSESLFGMPLGVGTTFSIACDAMVTNVPPTSEQGTDDIAGLYFTNAQLAVRVQPSTEPGEFAFAIEENSPGGYSQHPAVGGTTSGWFRVVITLTNTGSGFVDSLSIDGVVLEANYSLLNGFVDQSPTAQVGWPFVNAQGTAQVYIDNVVATWE